MSSGLLCLALICLTEGSTCNQDCLFDALRSHLTNIHPLVTAVLHRVEISRGRAGSLERGAHGELCCPVAVFSAANLSLQAEFEKTVRSPKNNVWSTPALNYLQRKSCVESVEIKAHDLAATL